jgi:hypothetical protein
LSRVALLMVVMMFAAIFGQAQVPQSGTGKIGASAVWQLPQDFLTKAHAVCDKSAAPASFGECFINQMSASGASADAVSFTRMLSQQSDGQVGIMTLFKGVGPIDEAQVFFPLRANDNYGLLLLNGDPKILDVDNLQKLDRASMEQNSMFQAVKAQFPQADVWSGDRSGSEPWPLVRALPNNGIEFVVSYPLIAGCHACRHVGTARFGWQFDASGKFLKAAYIPTQPPPKLKHPAQRMPPPGGATQPSATPDQPAPTATEPPQNPK